MELLDEFGLDLNMTTYRILDPSIGRWLSVDPRAEEAGYHMSPYCSMNNNPISIADPEGDLGFLAAVGVGALIGGGTGAIQGGWDGLWKGALMGAASGAASFGLGSLTSGMSTAGANLSAAGVNNSLGALSTITNIAGHSAIGGLSSLASGGNFGSGALSGGFSSVSGLTLGGLGNGGQLAAGALSGGVGSVLGGGNFWQGAGQGLITTGLNHLIAHSIPDAGSWDLNGDGKLSLKEANRWFRIGKGQDITVDAQSVDLDFINPNEWALDEYRRVQTLIKSSSARVYGNMDIWFRGGRQFHLGRDEYHFPHAPGAGFFRNFANQIGKTLAGEGNLYYIPFWRIKHRKLQSTTFLSFWRIK